MAGAVWRCPGGVRFVARSCAMMDACNADLPNKVCMKFAFITRPIGINYALNSSQQKPRWLAMKVVVPFPTADQPSTGGRSVGCIQPKGWGSGAV